MASVALSAESSNWSAVQTRHRAALRRARDEEHGASRALCQRCQGHGAQQDAPAMPVTMMMGSVHHSSPPPGAAMTSVSSASVGIDASGKRSLAQANPHAHHDHMQHKRPGPHSL